MLLRDRQGSFEIDWGREGPMGARLARPGNTGYYHRAPPGARSRHRWQPVTEGPAVVSRSMWRNRVQSQSSGMSRNRKERVGIDWRTTAHPGAQGNGKCPQHSRSTWGDSGSTGGGIRALVVVLGSFLEAESAFGGGIVWGLVVRGWGCGEVGGDGAYLSSPPHGL